MRRRQSPRTHGRITRSPGAQSGLSPWLRNLMMNGPQVLPNVIGDIDIAISCAQPWMKHAACLDSDPEVFYPEKGAQQNAQKARRICSQCPVRDSCLEYALKNDEPFGVWGGMTYKERKAWKRTQKKQLSTP